MLDQVRVDGGIAIKNGGKRKFKRGGIRRAVVVLLHSQLVAVWQVFITIITIVTIVAAPSLGLGLNGLGFGLSGLGLGLSVSLSGMGSGSRGRCWDAGRDCAVSLGYLNSVGYTDDFTNVQV